MRLIPILCALALAACVLTPVAAAPPRIGMNLDGVTYYNKAFPFIDRMKTADDWGVAGPATEPLALTADGYPAGIPAGAQSVYTIVQTDPAPARYVITWAGKAGFGFRFLADAVETAPNRIVVQVRPGTIYLVMDAVGLDPADPLRDMHVVREDQVPLFQAGKVFNPAFVDRLRPFDTIRAMDWARTNTAGRVATWANRPVPGQASWSFAQGGGVPIEVQVGLANELGRNLWLNIPFTADDDYVARAVKLVKATLRPDLHVYVEWSNEVWNWGFPAATMASQAGVKAGFDPGAGPNLFYYGYRSAQIAKVARAAFGADPTHRLRMVLATQTAFTGMEQFHILPGVQKVGDPAKLFDAYAVATYFYGALDPANAATWGRTVEQARGGDAGLTAFLDSLAAESLPQTGKWLAYQGTVAKKNGWELVAYEGGQHLALNPGGNPDDATAVAAMVDRALADPRMTGLYRRMVDLFADAGGTTLVAFNEAGKLWGALPTIYDEHSARYDALVAAAKAGETRPRTTAEVAGDYLAANPRIVTRAELTGAIWPAGAPATAGSQVDAAIAALRKGGATIVSETGWRQVPRP